MQQRLEDGTHPSAELRNGIRPVTDLVFFLHGWNKSAASAESDYQNFLCRLHSELRTVAWDRKNVGGLLVVGIFWRSTITNRDQEPFLLKPFSYFQVRKRADQIAQAGIAKLLQDMTPWMKENLKRSSKSRTHLIGHSFGGRMLITALKRLSEDKKIVDFLDASSRTNIALLNAAVDNRKFTWIAKEVKRATQAGKRARLRNSTNSYLYNLYSKNE